MFEPASALDISNLLPILIGFAFAWLLVLSILLYFSTLHYRKLVKTGGSSDLQTILEKILSVQDSNRKSIINIARELERMDKDGRLHIQKSGLVRYNPFEETGGKQSFSLAILNEDGTGFVITGLHARDRTRVYVKDVVNGGSTYELSREEKKAIEIAK